MCCRSSGAVLSWRGSLVCEGHRTTSTSAGRFMALTVLVCLSWGGVCYQSVCRSECLLLVFVCRTPRVGPSQRRPRRQQQQQGGAVSRVHAGKAAVANTPHHTTPTWSNPHTPGRGAGGCDVLPASHCHRARRSRVCRVCRVCRAVFLFFAWGGPLPPPRATAAGTQASLHAAGGRACVCARCVCGPRACPTASHALPRHAVGCAAKEVGWYCVCPQSVRLLCRGRLLLLLLAAPPGVSFLDRRVHGAPGTRMCLCACVRACVCVCVCVCRHHHSDAQATPGNLG
jgi:hypothetical protein